MVWLKGSGFENQDLRMSNLLLDRGGGLLLARYDTAQMVGGALTGTLKLRDSGNKCRGAGEGKSLFWRCTPRTEQFATGLAFATGLDCFTLRVSRRG
jgi:hypothetical protein